MLSQYKSFLEPKLLGFGKMLGWMNPNALTFIGIIPQLAFYFLMKEHRFAWAALALAFSSIDMLDGIVARANNKVTAFGGFLDSTMDRVADFIIIAAFYASGLINLNLAAALLVISYLVSYVRSRAELASENKIKFNSGLIERPERIIFLLFVILVQIFFPDLNLAEPLVFLLTILSLVTLFQRMTLAYKEL